MEILQLKYFCDAALTENFSKTAHKFGVPASNISQCIKRLESELSTQLFIREANKVILSSQGKKFYDTVSKAISLLEDARLQLTSDPEASIMRICITSNRRIAMNAIEKFRHLNPEVSIEISHGNPNDDVPYDLIIASDELENISLERKLIVSEKISLAISEDNPLALKAEITKNDLGSQQFISMNKESSMYHVMKRMCTELEFEPRIVIHSDDPFYVRKCVELGLGIAFFPGLSWEGQFSDNVVIKEFGDFKRNTYAYWHKDKHIKKAVKDFLSLLISEFNNMTSPTTKMV